MYYGRPENQRNPYARNAYVPSSGSGTLPEMSFTDSMVVLGVGGILLLVGACLLVAVEAYSRRMIVL